MRKVLPEDGGGVVVARCSLRQAPHATEGRGIGVPHLGVLAELGNGASWNRVRARRESVARHNVRRALSKHAHNGRRALAAVDGLRDALPALARVGDWEEGIRRPGADPQGSAEGRVACSLRPCCAKAGELRHVARRNATPRRRLCDHAEAMEDIARLAQQTERHEAAEREARRVCDLVGHNGARVHVCDHRAHEAHVIVCAP